MSGHRNQNQNRKSNSRNSSNNRDGGRNKPNALEVVKKAFKMNGKDYYDDLLKIEAVKDSDELLDGESLNAILDCLERFVENNYKGLTTSQLRNIFSQIKKAKLAQLPMLRPKLAYVAARQKNERATIITTFIGDLIKRTVATPSAESARALKSLKANMEALVAYHKFYNKSGN